MGPDLAGVNTRRSETWLIAFVQHSQAVIASGDSDAVALAAQYPGLTMPDWPLSDDEVRAVLAYIQQVESAGPAPAPTGTPVPGDPDLGRHLFQGTTRLVNGGPACNSCHNVTHTDVIGGGVLAKELTTVFTRLGGPGVRAIVGSSPFPVMQRAYQDRPLTEAEVGALVAFLEQADAEQSLAPAPGLRSRSFGGWSGRRGDPAGPVFPRLARTPEGAREREDLLAASAIHLR